MEYAVRGDVRLLIEWAQCWRIHTILGRLAPPHAWLLDHLQNGFCNASPMFLGLYSSGACVDTSHMKRGQTCRSQQGDAKVEAGVIQPEDTGVLETIVKG